MNHKEENEMGLDLIGLVGKKNIKEKKVKEKKLGKNAQQNRRHENMNMKEWLGVVDNKDYETSEISEEEEVEA